MQTFGPINCVLRWWDFTRPRYPTSEILRLVYSLSCFPTGTLGPVIKQVKSTGWFTPCLVFLQGRSGWFPVLFPYRDTRSRYQTSEIHRLVYSLAGLLPVLFPYLQGPLGFPTTRSLSNK